MDQFEQIYADAEDSARVMALVVHPYIMGAPHRLKYFRRIFETSAEIRRAVLDRRADPRLVSVGRAQSAVSSAEGTRDDPDGKMRLAAYFNPTGHHVAIVRHPPRAVRRPH